MLNYQRVTKTKTQIGKDIEGGKAMGRKKNWVLMYLVLTKTKTQWLNWTPNPKLLARHHGVPGVSIIKAMNIEQETAFANVRHIGRR